MSKAIAVIGGIPTNNPALRYLLEVAVESGASVAGEIDVVAELCYQRESALARIKVAYAGPKSSSRIVISLPVLTVLVAQLAGFDLFGAVVQRPVLGISILFGALLLLTARAVSSKLISRALPKESYAGYFLMAVALASGGGANLSKAQKIAFDSHSRVFGQEPNKLELTTLAEISNLVEITGARVSDLLKSQARNMQRNHLTTTELRIERLGVQLMLPLGLAVLPAFICLAVIPLMSSMFGPN